MDTLPTFDEISAELFPTLTEKDECILAAYMHLHQLHQLTKDDDSKLSVFIKTDILPSRAKAVCDYLKSGKEERKKFVLSTHGRHESPSDIANSLKYILEKSVFALRDFAKYWES